MLTPGKIYTGTELELTFSILSDDVGVDPDTVTFLTIDPSGTKSTYVYGTDDEVGRTSAGNYYARIFPGSGGRWYYRWQTTGTNKVVTKEGDFIVQRSPFVDDLEPNYYRR